MSPPLQSFLPLPALLSRASQKPIGIVAVGPLGPEAADKAEVCQFTNNPLVAISNLLYILENQEWVATTTHCRVLNLPRNHGHRICPAPLRHEIMTPAMKPRVLLALFPLILLSILHSLAQAPVQAPVPASTNPMAPGQKLINEGKLDEAISFYKNAAESNPKDAWQAQLGIGAALDLKGDYGAARQEIQKAIDTAPANGKVRGLRTMAVSYAFTGDASQAGKYEAQAYQLQTAANDFDAAAGTADEAARIYLENGDLENARKWYEKGHATAMQNPKLTDAEKDLWNFRWENAQARIAARKGNAAEARHIAASAKAIVDKGTNPDQAQFVPYLEGYVAFYGGDYPAAINELKKANPKDPFVLVLIAQAYEKSGDQKNAMDYYHKVLQIYAHTPTGAFSRPLAEKKAGS
jgi:tetratricopeptide (TPR) repeat protein